MSRYVVIVRVYLRLENTLFMVIYENKQKFFHDYQWNLFNFFVFFFIRGSSRFFWLVCSFS